MVEGKNATLALQWLGGLGVSLNLTKKVQFARSLDYRFKKPRRFNPENIEDPDLKAGIVELLSFWETAEFYVLREDILDDVEILTEMILSLLRAYYSHLEPKYVAAIDNFRWKEDLWEDEKAILWLREVDFEAEARGKEWFFCDWSDSLYNQSTTFEVNKIAQEELREDLRNFLDFCREANFTTVGYSGTSFSPDVYLAIGLLDNLVEDYLAPL